MFCLFVGCVCFLLSVKFLQFFSVVYSELIFVFRFLSAQPMSVMTLPTELVPELEALVS